jgi:shikimate kinase
VDIPTIFEFEGEDGFRHRETEMLRDLLGREKIVLATGGGIVIRPENRELLKQHCVLYLRVPVAEQYRRTRKSRRRPLLNATHDPRKRLEELFQLRDPLYQWG